MDTAEILELGAKQALVRIAKEIEELLQAVPGANRFARDILREALGMGRIGRKAEIDGKAAKRLADALAESRSKRDTRNGNARYPGGRPKMSAAQKAEVKKRMAARWTEAHKLGYTGQSIPTNEVIARLRAKAAKSKKQTTTTKPASTAADQASPATPAA